MDTQSKLHENLNKSCDAGHTAFIVRTRHIDLRGPRTGDHVSDNEFHKGGRMRAEIMALLLNGVLFAGWAWAYDAQDISNCNGVEWDESHGLVVSKITAVPRINFIKSPYDDDFKAAGCPAFSCCGSQSSSRLGLLRAFRPRDFVRR